MNNTNYNESRMEDIRIAMKDGDMWRERAGAEEDPEKCAEFYLRAFRNYDRAALMANSVDKALHDKARDRATDCHTAGAIAMLPQLLFGKSA